MAKGWFKQSARHADAAKKGHSAPTTIEPKGMPKSHGVKRTSVRDVSALVGLAEERKRKK